MEVNIQIIIAFVVGLVLLILIVPLVFGSKNDNFSVDGNNEQNLLYTSYSMENNKDIPIYDATTKSVMSSSQFMDTAGIIAPRWTPPAWSPDALGPALRPDGELDVSAYDEDPRLLYNKCSLACCGPQYPTGFNGEIDSSVCDKNGKNKYLSSNYGCRNETDGGSGCLCMTKKQAKGLSGGWQN